MSAAVQSERNLDYRPGGVLYGEIVEFLYREADMLDNNRFDEWLALFTEDIRYEMPVRTTQMLSKGPGFQEMAFFDDNIHSLRTRIKRLQTDAAWAETPPSRTRHFVSNVLLSAGKSVNELFVSINFLIARSRGEQGYQLFTGRREDTLRRAADSSLRIAQRRILVDQTVITATNLSILF